MAHNVGMPKQRREWAYQWHMSVKRRVESYRKVVNSFTNLEKQTALLSHTRLVTACFQGGWVKGEWTVAALSIIRTLKIGDIAKTHGHMSQIFGELHILRTY